MKTALIIIVSIIVVVLLGLFAARYGNPSPIATSTPPVLTDPLDASTTCKKVLIDSTSQQGWSTYSIPYDYQCQ